MHTQIQYYILGQTSGWRRGPFTEAAVAAEAQKLAVQKRELVTIERHTKTVFVETIAKVGEL